MADSNFSAIRARLRYGSLDEFIDGYSRFITRGGMFIPMAPAKLKPIGTTIRFQFLLEDGTTAMLGEGVVRQINGPDDAGSTVGMLVKFTKLSPDTKSLVDRVLRDKDEQSSPIEETVDTDDNPTAPARQPAPASEDPPTSELDADDLAVTAKRDAVEHEAQDQQDQSTDSFDEDDLFGEPGEALADADSAATREGESRDAIALSSTQDSAADDHTDRDEGPGLSAGEVFSEAEEQSEAQEESEPEELDLDDIEEDSAEPTPPPPEESEAKDGEGETGPRELGRTEAGLQIMAFDDVTDEDAEEFANFALGGEEDDVDQMFAGIFGDEGDGADDFLDDAFGGGGDSDESEAGGADPFGGALGGDGAGDEDALFGEAEGGAFGGANEDSFIADAQAEEQAAVEPEQDEFMLESEVESDLSVDEGVSPMTNELHTEDIVDEELVEEADEPQLEDELEDEIELELQEESEAEPVGPSLEQPEPEYGGSEELNSALNELPDEDALLPDEDEEAGASEEILLQEEPLADAAEDEVAEPEDEVEDEVDRESLAAQLAGEEEPSDELINLLGSLEDSEVEDTEIQLQQLKEDIEEKQKEEGLDADDEESLESLLAVANAEIEAKHKQEEEEKKGEDILDDLLGDDLPPPPSEESQFDMPLPDEKEKKKKKKKKGFISKLFGKD
ncbi:MAG: hypothetical protein ACQEVA_03220 [Myxococcota bacterium]